MYRKGTYSNSASFGLKLSWEWGREEKVRKAKQQVSNLKRCEDTTKPSQVCRYVEKITCSTVADRLLCFNFFKKSMHKRLETFIVSMHTCVRKIILQVFLNQKTNISFYLLAFNALSKPKVVSLICLHLLAVFTWHQGAVWIWKLQ